MKKTKRTNKKVLNIYLSIPRLMRYTLIALALLLLLVTRIVVVYISFSTCKNDETTQKYYVTIIDTIEFKNDSAKYLVMLGYEKNNKIHFKHKYIMNIYNQTKMTNYNCLDVLLINGKIQIPKMYGNEGEYDYYKYLKSKNIFGQIIVYEKGFDDSLNVHEVKNKEFSFGALKYLKVIYDFKNKISALIDDSMPKEPASLLKGMVYGDTKDMSEEIKNNFEKIGISHLTAVSGSNVATVILVIDWLFNKIKLKKMFRIIISTIIACAFTCMASFELSIVRATLMLVIKNIFEIANKKGSPYTSLMLATYVIAIYNPYAMLNTGMQLSFMATLGIISFSKPIADMIVRFLKIRKKVAISIIEYATITMSAQLLIIPIQLSSFNATSLFVITSNVIACMLDTPIRTLGVVAVYLSFIPKLSSILLWFVTPLLKLMIYMAQVLATITKEIQTIAYPSAIWLLYYVIVLVIYIFFQMQSSEKLSRATKERVKNKCKKIVAVLLVVLIVAIFCITVFVKNTLNYLYCFNVGQGQMTYIQYQNTTILVDCGSTSKNRASNTFLNYARKYNITTIDAVVITHFHVDHVNGLAKIAQNIKIQSVYIAKIDVDTQKEGYIEMFESFNINVVEVETGDNIHLNEIKMCVLSPNDKNTFVNQDILNSYSLVVLFEMKNKGYLFMGDATTETEEQILNNFELDKVFFLQVAHHGSSSSSKEEFIESIKPTVAVISSQKKVYGHPSKTVCERLQKHAKYLYVLENIGGLKIPI